MVDVAEGFGTRTLFIFKFEPGITFHLTREERLRKPLTYEQAMAIKEHAPVEAVGVEIYCPWAPRRDGQVQGPGNGGHQSSAAPRRSTSSNINADLEDGRLYTDSTTCTAATWR